MKKEKRTKTKEQRTMSKEQRIMKKTRKKPVLSALCSLFSVNCSLLIVLCSLFIALCSLLISCDVDHDFMQRIDDEIAWSNAARLNVVLNFPGSWGQGSITTIAQNRRQGYAFNLDFTPMQGYTIESWHAFRTDEIPAAFTNWMREANPGAELKKMAAIGELQWGDGKDIELTDSPDAGFGTFSIRINIKDNVTIVPLCSDAPEIKLTYPPVKEEGEALDYFRPTETITIDLTSPVNPDTVRLEAGYIEIFAWDLGADGNPAGAETNITESGYFNARWIAGLWRIIIEPDSESASYIENKMITVKIGNGIKNILDYSIIGGPFNISWKTSRILSIDVTKLEASYDEKDNTITVEWTLSASHSARISYTENNNERQWLTSSSGAIGTAKIINVEPLAGEVRNGQAVSNIKRYNIWIQLYDSGESIFRDSGFPITIYNFNGMTVSRANPTELIDTADDFRPVSAGGKIVTDAAGANKSYLLTRDIEIVAHTPISNFQGKFYGNGHTITINSMSDDAYMGLFGTVGSGSTVRDLTVEYDTGNPSPNNAVTVNPLTANPTASFGGIAGTVNNSAQGGVQFENVQVTGAVIVGGSSEIHVGGLVGRIAQNTALPRTSIRNSYSAFNLQVNRHGYIGGVVGVIGGSRSSGAPAFLERISAVGDITVGTSESVVNGFIFVGGIAGAVRGANTWNNEPWDSPLSDRAVLRDAEYCQGNITVFNEAGINSWVAGAIGHIGGNSDIQNCRALAGSFNITRIGEVGRYFFVGGFMGEDGRQGTSVANIISNCYSETNVFVHVEGILDTSRPDSGLGIGGFAGRITGEISYCYAKGNVSASSSHRVFAGGFVGDMAVGTVDEPCNISHCFATGNVSVPTRGGESIYAGGFIGFARASINNSYALGDVFLHSPGTSNGYAGGFAGQHIRDLINCFAGGSVILHRSTSTGESNAGGLVGSSYRSGDPPNSVARIQNCVVVPRNVHEGLSITVTGPGARNVGRIFGERDSRISQEDISNNHAWNGIRLFSDAVYSSRNPAEISAVPVMSGTPVLNVTAAPVLSGSPVLQGSISNAVISGLSISDTSGFAFVSNMSVTRNPVNAGGTPFWNGHSITGIDLSDLTTTSNFLQFDLTVRNNSGSTAVYRIEVKPNRNLDTEADDPPDVFNFADFNATVTSVSSNLLRSISGIFISDSGGSGIDRTTMTVTSNPAGAGGTPVWNGNSITGIDLSGLTSNGHFLQFEFSIRDRAGNNVIYHIRLTRNAAGVFNFGNPAIVLQNSSSFVITSDASGHHGADAQSGTLRTPSFWIDLDYTTANGWDLSTVGSRGYPRLARLGGQ